MSAGAKEGAAAGSVFGNIAALWALAGDGTRRTGRRLGLRLLCAAVADTVMLYSINDTLRVYKAGDDLPVRQLFLFLTAMIVSVVVLHGLMRDVSAAYQRTARALRLRMVSKLRRIDLAALERIGGGRLRVVLTMDTERLLRATTALVDVLMALGLCALTIPYVLLTSTKAALLGLAALGVVTAMTARKGSLLAQGLAAAESRKVALVESCLSLVRGFKQFKQNASKREVLLDDVRARAADLAAARHATYQRYAADDARGFIAFFTLQAGVAFLLPLLFPAEQAAIGPLLMTIWYIAGSTTAIFRRQAELAEAAGSLTRLRALEGEVDQALTQQAEAPRPQAEAPFAVADVRELRAEGLCYRHEGRAGASGGAFALGPIDVTLRRGEIIFVTGNNGSGKSTFLKLLLGLYEPSAGRLRCDGQVLPREVPRAYLELFGVILSDFVLFDRLYGMEDVDPQRVARLLQQMDLAEEVTFAAGRFSRTDLSTGQRKRLAMIAALLLDRPIYVFDEWAADQDPEFRGVFYRELLPELRRQGKTVIAVTHDEHYFGVADRRLHFQDGRLVAP